MSLRVSDHAVARYCERVLGLDTAALDKAMADLVGDQRSGRFKLPGLDMIAVVKDRTILTFVPLEKSPKIKVHLTAKKQRRQRIAAGNLED